MSGGNTELKKLYAMVEAGEHAETEKINLLLADQISVTGKPGDNMNMVVVGPPGCGKTFSYMLPTILSENECSMVIDDKKGYLYRKTAESLREKGYLVFKIDFTNFSGNMNYNCFENIRTDEDVMRIADFMIPPQGDHVDRFWEMSSKDLFRILVQVAQHEHPEGINLKKFMEVFNKCGIKSAESEEEQDELETLMDYHRRIGLHYDAMDEYAKLKGASDRTWSCILNSLRVELQKYKSNELYRITNNTTFPFGFLGDIKIALFVISSDTDASMYPMVQLLYREMIDVLIKQADRCGGRLPMHVRFLVDDFASGVQQTQFENVIANCRSRNISYMLGFQSMSQLRALYRERSESILDCVNYMVFYGSSNNETNTYLSKTMQRPLREIQQMDEEKVCLIRRGQTPRFAKRVQTLKMPEYIRTKENQER